jgi:predicted NBD/HSP70 family sugar kinase
MTTPSIKSPGKAPVRSSPDKTAAGRQPEAPAPRHILVLDVGGSHVKALTQGSRQPIKIATGPEFTPDDMLTRLRSRLHGRHYDAVSIGIPAPVIHGRLPHEPVNLGKGWVGFDFQAAFGCPVRLINDAAMQALGSYSGRHMLFLGLGTGLGSAMIVDGVIEPLELAHLPFRKHTFEYYVGEQARERLSRKKWRANVDEVIETLRAALEPDYIVLGGGNVRHLRKLPTGVHRGDNANAFLGGFRLWQELPDRQ